MSTISPERATTEIPSRANTCARRLPRAPVRARPRTKPIRDRIVEAGRRKGRIACGGPNHARPWRERASADRQYSAAVVQGISLWRDTFIKVPVASDLGTLAAFKLF